MESTLKRFDMSGLAWACVCIHVLLRLCVCLCVVWGELLANWHSNYCVHAFLSLPHSCCVTKAGKASGQWESAEGFWGSLIVGMRDWTGVTLNRQKVRVFSEYLVTDKSGALRCFCMKRCWVVKESVTHRMYAVASHFPVEVVHTATLHVATGCQAQKRQKKNTVKVA